MQIGLEARRKFLQIPAALMAMGELGGITRLGGGFFGSDLTFAIGDSTSAPGQMPVDTVRRGLAALGLLRIS
jgi:3-dehydroquinate dehydratase-1